MYCLDVPASVASRAACHEEVLMFRAKKTTDKPEPRVWGWSERHLEMLSKHISTSRPVIKMYVTGYRHNVEIDSTRFSFKQENELVGELDWGRLRVSGNFEVNSDPEDIEKDDMGWLNITSYENLVTEEICPCLRFGFTLKSEYEEKTVRGAFRSTTSNPVYLALAIDPVSDINNWLAIFKEDGISPTLCVRRVYLDAKYGLGSFD